MPDQFVPDQPTPDRSTSGPGPVGEIADEVEIDLASFLPEGVAYEPVDGDEAPGVVSAGGSNAPTSGTGGPDDIDTDLLDAVERDLNDVDAALRALDEGTYGTCAVCASPIPQDLLATDPVRRTCTAHA